MQELCDQSIGDLNRQLKGQAVAVRDIVSSVVKRIEEVEPTINAFITLEEEVLTGLGPSPKNPLAGIPIAIKDNICTKGLRTTCGSRILSDFVPSYDATVVSLLRRAGAIVLGKTNMDEFGMGSSNEHSYFSVCRNPWNLQYVPGGSSGGSAAAVAAGEATCALGSDTGGSIRLPAAFCGVVGLKPTYGRISRYGLVAFASSLDQIGTVTKDVTDAAILLSHIAAPDPLDSTSVNVEVPNYMRALEKEIKGSRIGVSREHLKKGVSEEVCSSIDDVILTFSKLGCKIVDVSLPHSDYSIPAYYLISTAEASSNLARYDGVRYGCRDPLSIDIEGMYQKTRGSGFGDEVKRRITLGTYCLSHGYYDDYYMKSLRVRRLIKEDFQSAWQHVDAIITPTSPTPAFEIGERTKDPLTMYLSDVFTVSANLAGLPAISIPCGLTSRGLPLGLQIVGRPFDESTILNLAHHYEKSTPWHELRPNLDREN
jgi:aspartyl-tRNA(Asn)/glutamyl-tRNA(Gln) amidotransferase subunit A